MTMATKQEFDDYIASTDKTGVGLCLTLKTGNLDGDGASQEQCFIVDADAITEIGRMNGYGINLLKATGIITAEEAAAFNVVWRKIIKS